MDVATLFPHSALLAGLLLAVALILWRRPPHPAEAALIEPARGRMAWVALGGLLAWTALYALVAVGEFAGVLHTALQVTTVGVAWASAATLLVMTFVAWRSRPSAAPPTLHAALEAARTHPEGQTPEMRRLLGRLRRLAKRLTLLGMLEVTLRALFLGLLVAAVYLLVDRLLFATGIDLVLGLASPLVLALAGGLIVGGLFAATSTLAAAVKADVALGLRERLSTVLTLRGTQAFEAAVRRDALRALDEARFEEVGKLRWPWEGTAALCLAGLLLVGALWLPTMRWLEPEPEPQRTSEFDRRHYDRGVEMLEANRERLRQLAEEVENDKVRETLEEVEQVLEDMRARPAPESLTEEQIKEEFAELSDLQERIREAQQELGALQQDMARMRDELAERGEAGEEGDGRDATQDFREALAQGEFDEAREALEQMEQMARELEGLDPESEEAEQLREALREMGEQLQEMAERLSNDNPLKEDLRELSQSMCCSGPGGAQERLNQLQQMQQGLDQLGNSAQMQLNQQLLQGLDQQLQQSKNEFAQALSEAQGDENGDDTTMAQPQEDIDWDALQEQLAAGGDCCGDNGGLGQGLNGMSGAGAGDGDGGMQHGGSVGEADVEPSEFLPWLQSGELQDGDIISTMRRSGEPEQGEARYRYRRAYEDAQRRSEDAMTRYALPSEYRRLVQDYFRQINPAGGDE